MKNKRGFFCLKYFLTIATIVFITVSGYAQSASGIIEGRISTSDNKPAEGITVVIAELNRNTIADNTGSFQLKNIKAGSYKLLITLIGYKDVEQEIAVEDGKVSRVSIQLQLSDKELSEVVVLGNKSSFKSNRISSSLRLQSPIIEIPQNIQVVSSKVIADQQIFDMLEGVTRNVSGASRVEHWDNYARITMRGSNVGAFRNGMNVSTTWGPLTEDMSMIERVEFVKGPAGFMLANGDPSGFYNVVTKKPSGRNKGEVNLSVGSFDLYRGALDLDGKLSKDGKLLYRVNVMGQVKGSHRPYDFNNRYSIVPVLKYLLDDKTSVTLEYTQQYSQVNVIGSNYVFSNRGFVDLPKNTTQAIPNMAPTNMTDRNVLAIFEHKMTDDWKFTAQAAYYNYQQQGSSMWPWSFSPTNDSLMQRGASIWDILGLSKMAQVYVNGEVKTGDINHKILGGLDMSNKEYYHDWNQGGTLGGLYNIYAPVPETVTAPVYDRSKDIRERGSRYYNGYTGFYVQDELGFLENRLRLTLAGRYTSLKAGDNYNGDSKSSKVTPRVGVSYSIDKNTAAYFVLDQSFMENYGTDWQKKAFDPITGTNLELGFKKDWMNGKWNSTVSIYQITRNNVLTVDPDHPMLDGSGNPTGQFYSRQTGEQRTRGIEVDVKGQLVRGLDVIVNYAYTDAKTTRDTDEKIVGRQVPGSSKHIHNTWLNYKFDHGKMNGLGISLGYQFQADRFPWYVFDNSSYNLPNYFRVDASLSYQRNKISYNLVVNNVLNKYLYSGAFYPYSSFYYWQAEPGTNLRFSVGYKF
jgi:iron complex outermembrane receptor protein